MMDIQAVDARIQALIEKQKLAGVAVCVKDQNGTLFEKGYGFRSLDQKTMVDPDTMFGIASMSKSITALCACILAAEGKLSLDAPVTDFFTNFRVPGVPREMPTVRHLCMHTAGIPPMEPLEWSIAMNSLDRDGEWARAMRATSPNQMDTIDQVVDYIASCPYPSLGMPGEYMSYSNEGYAILSYIIDQAAGMKLEDYAMARIFRPVGMTRTIMDDDCVSARALSGGNITSLFEMENGVRVGDDHWSKLPPFRGCAMVKSTARDMASYYRMLSAYGMHEGCQVIPKAAVEMLIGRSFPEVETGTYCLGLNKRTKAGHVICEHSGGLHGVSTKGGLLLGEDTGFAVLCNQGDEDMDEIMWTLYNAVMGLPLDASHCYFTPSERTFSAPEMIVGNYIGHEGVPVHLKVSQDGEKLIAKNENRSLILTFCGATRFIGRQPGENPASPSRYEFFIRNGKAWGVRVGTRILGRDED